MYVPLFVYHNIPVIYYTSLYRDINDMKLKNIVFVTLLKLAASHTSQTSLFFGTYFFLSIMLEKSSSCKIFPSLSNYIYYS